MDPLPRLVRRSELLASGHAPDEIDRMRNGGLLRPVRRGVYLPDGTEPDAETAHVLAARAVAPVLAADAAFGHVTAALLLGLPVWSVPLGRRHVVRPRVNGGRIRRCLHVHPAPLSPRDVVLVDGLRVTSPARTVADLARTLPADRALVVADAALFRARRAARTGVPETGAATAEDITGVLERLPGRHGLPAARRLVAFADGASESPGESRSRLAIRESGLPAPILQWTVPGTRFRCDFGWPDRGVVGEFDGRKKYGRRLRPGDDPAEVVWREKRREDEIRALGLTMVRWVWDELADARFTGRLRPALTR